MVTYRKGERLSVSEGVCVWGACVCVEGGGGEGVVAGFKEGVGKGVGEGVGATRDLISNPKADL